MTFYDQNRLFLRSTSLSKAQVTFYDWGYFSTLIPAHFFIDHARLFDFLMTSITFLNLGSDTFLFFRPSSFYRSRSLYTQDQAQAHGNTPTSKDQHQKTLTLTLTLPLLTFYTTL